MIGFLSGTIRDTYGNSVIVDVGGVGYIVNVADRLMSQYSMNSPCTLYIHTHVREDALDLYGFITKEELRLFELLLTVSGIGPKTGLTVIDRGTDAIQKAVQRADVDFFTTIPRLGKKNAQKIIIELKNKLGALEDLDLQSDSGETKEILEALLAMGFVKNEITEAMKKLSDKEVTIEQKIRRVLQLLSRKNV